MAAAASAADASTQLSLAEHVCLALIDQKVSHGWAVGSMLAPDGEVGRVWTLSRALTYRAIEGLVDKRCVSRRGQAAGRSRDRVVLSATPSGRRRSSAWLDEPVQHLRDVRTELLVKLVLRQRAGMDNTALLERQAALFEPTIESLTSSQPDDDVVDVWRREHARAVRRFLDQVLHPVAPSTSDRRIRISARNQLRGTVTSVQHGAVMASVHATVESRQPVTATITRESATELDLTVGDPVTLIVKASDVMIAVDLDALAPPRQPR